MTTINPYDHLIRLYKILISQISSAVALNNSESSKNNPQKILISVMTPGVCAVCQQKGSLKRSENISNMFLVCYNIEIVNRPAAEQDLQICEACIARLQDAFNFRKQVESVHYPLYKEGLIQNGLKIKKKPVNKDSLPANDCSNIFNYPSDNEDDENNEQFFNENGNCFDTETNVNVELKPQSTEEIVIPKLDPFATVCPVCKEKFSLSRDLTRHFPVHFSSFLCEICGAAFLKKKSLIRHIGTHNDKRYSCKLCDKHYSNSGALFQHVGMSHDGKKRYRCAVCTDRFCDYSSRSKHMSQVHALPARIYNCPKCPKKFFRSSRLSEHIRREHLKIRNHSCMMCECQFFSNSELNQHMLKHTGVKEFRCNVCGKLYARKKTLTEHLKIHANLRAYKCELCEKAFIQKCTLKGHMKTHAKI